MTTSNNIPLSKLDASRSHNFDYKMDEVSLKEIAERNGWRKAENLKIEGLIEPIEQGWQFDARISGKVTIPCVISDAPVNFSINLEISRKYLKNYDDFPQDFSWDEEFDVEIEELPRALDLDGLISEALLLDLPQYPKLAKYQDAEPWQSAPDDQQQDDQNTTRPFANLRDLLQEKKTHKS